MFTVIVLDVWLPILTDWGLPVRKVRTQLQRVGGTPRVESLLTSLDGITVLNAELKSMNNSRTKLSLLSRCVRAVCIVVLMASSVDLFGLYANWRGSRYNCLDVAHDDSLDAFHNNRSQCNGLVVVKTDCCIHFLAVVC